jgi:hypothetical protein
MRIASGARDTRVESMRAALGIGACLLTLGVAHALWRFLLQKVVPRAWVSRLAKPAQFIVVMLSFAACNGAMDLYGPGTGPALVYADNGFYTSYGIAVDGEAAGSVASRGFTLLELEAGEHVIEIREADQAIENTTINVRAGIEYVYNISQGYTYYIESHVYGDELFADIPDPRLVGNELFFRMPDVDFEFGERAPASIEVPQWNTGRQVRTSLTRR